MQDVNVTGHIFQIPCERMSRTIAFTMLEGSYHYGACSLLNSLIRNGFEGTIVIGYRGDIPFWADPPEARGRTFSLLHSDKVTVTFEHIEEPGHFTYKKASFLLRLADERPDAESFFYFDPDVYVLSQWVTFCLWVESGIACCADIKPWMPANHPVRTQWRSLFPDVFSTPPSPNQLPFYFNAGFFGVSRAHISFVERYQEIQTRIMHAVGEQSTVSVRGSGRQNPFYIPDQDAMNIALMTTPHQVAGIGPDGMNFDVRAGGFLLAHAVHQIKPWKKKLLLSTLLGRGITPADIAYWSYADGPFCAYPAPILRLQRAKLRLAMLWCRLRGDLVAQ